MADEIKLRTASKDCKPDANDPTEAGRSDNFIPNTDNTGTDTLNIPLSKARAQRVRDYFVLNGLETVPMTVDGFGATRPTADNSTEAGKAANRRVDVTVTRSRQ